MDMLKIENDISLKAFNTFGIDVKAAQFLTIQSVDSLKVLRQEGFLAKKMLILGGGSNLLFTNDFQGLVLYNSLKGVEIVGEDKHYIMIKAWGGESWCDFVDYTVKNNWGGLENLSLIPGTVGAAPVQNIGAYGAELKDCLYTLEAFNLETGEIKEFSNSLCAFGYRDSIFKNKEKGEWFVLNVTFCLDKNPNPRITYAPLNNILKNKIDVNIQEISATVKQIRRSKLPDPQELCNAGSFFKNPVLSQEQLNNLQNRRPNLPYYNLGNHQYKISAAWLIEKAGWKGYRNGQVGVNGKQPLVLVNFGGASGSDILNLSKQIQSSLFKKFGINLEREVRVV